MKLQVKIFILLSTILGVFIGTFLTYQYIRIHEKNLLYKENRKSQELVIEKVLQLNRVKYEQLIDDNSAWDEMVDFAHKPDAEWAKDNVDFFVNSFDLSFVQVYNRDNFPIYQFGDSVCLNNFGHLDQKMIQTFFADTAFVHYFQYCGDNLIEIFGAIIVPAADSNTRETPAQGYLFLGLKWDLDYIEEHSQATNYFTELVSGSNLPNLKQDSQKDYFRVNLPDYKGYTVANLIFSKNDNLSDEMELFWYLSLIVTAIACVAVVIFLFYFRKIILVPIRQLSTALDTRNPKYLDVQIENTDEFKKMKSLILQFFLQEELLRNKNAELKENNATKDKLFSIIAHDLKNPVGNILTISELLVDSFKNKDFETSEELLELIGSQSKETMNLLETLFDWAKSQSGQINYSPEELILKEIVLQVVEIINPVASIKGITVEMNLEPDLKVIADKNMIHTVLRNLVSNAIKFTNTGGFVQILACKLADGIEISVKDSGVGMTGDTLKSLFHIDSSVTTNGTAGEKGSGLGLIICMEFIEKHGSHIHVESEPERGSKFSFSLPMA
jgi:signal transduction histidine kinase